MTRPSPATHRVDQLLTRTSGGGRRRTRGWCSPRGRTGRQQVHRIPARRRRAAGGDRVGLVSLGKGVSMDFAAARAPGADRDGQQLPDTHLHDAGASSLLTGPNADVGVVAYQMNMLVKKIGEHLSAAPRATAGPGE